MPYSLTERQKEYLSFIRHYIADNECSPSLAEIASYFNVKPPTVHKTLKSLQNKGYLYFHRSKSAGFFIRLLERAGSSEVVTEICIVGKFNKFGEIFEFPTNIGHFPSLLAGANPEEVFSLMATEDIPQAGILMGDLIIFDAGKKPQPNDISIFLIGNRWYLIRIASKTYDRNPGMPETANNYPIPEGLIEDRGQMLNWYPLAYDEETNEYFMRVAEEGNFNIRSIPTDFVAGIALRLSRKLAF